MNVRDIDTSSHRRPDHPIEPIFWKRWSPRAMTGEALTRDEFSSLMEAARWAPSSYNEQPWRFIYAHRGTPHFDRLVGLLMDANKAWADRAGTLLVLVSKKTFTGNGKPNTVHTFDCGSAWQNLALQASALGLVAHGMAGFDRERARTELRVPDDFSVEAMVALGRPGNVEDLPQPLRERETPSPRKPIRDIMMEGAFEGA